MATSRLMLLCAVFLHVLIHESEAGKFCFSLLLTDEDEIQYEQLSN